MRALAGSLPEARYRAHYVKVTCLSKRDMCRKIARAVGAEPAGSYPALVGRLPERFAAFVQTDAVRSVLFLDEARDMRPEVLSMLRILTNFEMEAHREKLLLTIGQTAPRVLLLDPLMRLHQMDENSAADISRLLGYLRELQRQFDMAVILTHHASKRRRSQPGQSLRGSSDLRAFGDSNAYIERHGARLMLTVEHRSAKAPEPIELELAAEPDGSGIHLTVAGGAPEPPGLAWDVELLLKESPAP